MTWLRFTADHDHRTPAFTIAYKAGWVGNVPHDIADAAVATGKAVRMRKASKDAEPVAADSVEDGADAEDVGVQGEVGAGPADTGAGAADSVSGMVGAEA